MKKFFLFPAIVAATLVGFVSCDDDDNDEARPNVKATSIKSAVGNYVVKADIKVNGNDTTIVLSDNAQLSLSGENLIYSDETYSWTFGDIKDTYKIDTTFNIDSTKVVRESGGNGFTFKVFNSDGEQINTYLYERINRYNDKSNYESYNYGAYIRSLNSNKIEMYIKPEYCEQKIKSLLPENYQISYKNFELDKKKYQYVYIYMQSK